MGIEDGRKWKDTSIKMLITDLMKDHYSLNQCYWKRENEFKMEETAEQKGFYFLVTWPLTKSLTFSLPRFFKDIKPHLIHGVFTRITLESVSHLVQ